MILSKFDAILYTYKFYSQIGSYKMPDETDEQETDLLYPFCNGQGNENVSEKCLYSIKNYRLKKNISRPV